MGNYKDLLTPELLIKIHDIRYTLPKAGELDWQDVWDVDWETPSEAKSVLFELVKPVMRELSKQPVDIELPSPDHPKYIEQCLGLTWLFDQASANFKGKDTRYSGLFFRPAADKISLALYHRADSPFKKETWLQRGWTIEDYIARIFSLWAPLIHSESIMTDHWDDINRVIVHSVRSEVEAYTGKPDPSALTEEQDEKDIELFDRLIANPPSQVHDMAEFAYPMLRIMTAHVALINRFGRYPYRNDAVGRDFKAEEEQWMAGTVNFKRMNPEVRAAVRKEIDAGRWSPLELNYQV